MESDTAKKTFCVSKTTSCANAAASCFIVLVEFLFLLYIVKEFYVFTF